MFYVQIHSYKITWLEYVMLNMETKESVYGHSDWILQTLVQCSPLRKLRLPKMLYRNIETSTKMESDYSVWLE